MPPIEMTPLRPVGAIASQTPRAVDAKGGSPAPATQAKPAVTAADALDPGTPPVDAERVAEIRKAIESGSYPVIPARVADAMIAAGFLLRSGK
jgi:negative regulator of flagellin synthesis FlgM